ncbi:phosphopantetheine-binding protein [Streptomyces sp. NPDC059853]|uniref:phosphopantetheine-binding protein n=1 Tax=Streptomyces sp. NPDC059853 TaxID=3346973 RepID=UPI003667BD62
MAENVRKRWCEVLETSQAAPDDDFFHSGGTSLLAARLTSVLREDLGVAIPITVLFDLPVLEEYAAEVSNLARATS